VVAEIRQGAGALQRLLVNVGADVGITGADKGKGGKYLVPAAWIQGQHPPGYHVVRAQHLRQRLVFRAFLVNGSDEAGVESVKKNCGSTAWPDAATRRDEVRQRLGRSGELRGTG